MALRERERMTIPTFLIAGGARCGTTGVVEGLRAHPRVFVTTPKEPHYFAYHHTGAHFTGPADAQTINRVAVTDTDAYLALYPAEHDYLALGEASVSTMYRAADAMPELLAINPAIKLVVLLREPVARAYSAHQYMVGRGLEPVVDFLDAVSREDQRREGGWHHIWHYTAMSRYAASLRTMMQAVPSDQLGVWFHDDLDADFRGTVEEILTFIGVSPDPDAAEVSRVNVSGRPRYPVAHRAVAWATAHEQLRSTLKRVIPFRLREQVRGRLLTTDPLAAEVRTQLEPLFTDDLREVRAMLPGPFPPWLPEARVS